MGGAFQFVKDTLGVGTTTADKASRASSEAAATQAGYQREALDYLKQIQQPVLEAQGLSRDRLNALASQGASPYQLASDADLLRNIESNPFYQAILGTQQSAEEAVLRNQAATGGFRGGDTQTGLARTAANIQQNALLSAFQNRQQRDLQQAGLNQQAFQNQLGIEGQLLGQPTQVGNIANLTAGIGQTLAQGQLGAAQAQLQGAQAGGQNLLNIGQLALPAFSDGRLKNNVHKIGEQNGYNVYGWDWAPEAEKFGLTGQGFGVLADEVEKIAPEAVTVKDGYKQVDYNMIGVNHG